MLFDEGSDYGRNSEDNYHVNARLHHLLYEQLYQVRSGFQQSEVYLMLTVSRSSC